MRIGSRQTVAKKLANFIKTAQAEPAIKPKIDDGTAPVEDAGPDEDVPGDDLAGETEEVEDLEKEDKVELEDVAESLEGVEDKLDSVVDALEEQKDILENVVSENTEEGFDEYKDDAEELEDEDLTPEEFGLDVDELILSKKESGMSLRDARKERLARTMKDEFDEPASTKKKFDPINPTPQITTVKKSDIPDMLKVALVLNDAKNAWSLVDATANDKPLYTIACDEKTATEDFAKQVIRDLAKMGAVKALKKYNAQKVAPPVVKPVDKSKLPAKEPDPAAALQPKKDEKLAKQALSEYKRKFDRCFRLALTAMHKNLIGVNPLKASLFEGMCAYGMPEHTAMRMIEAAFSVGAIPHFEAALAQADKYLGMNDEAFVETESTIGEMTTKAIEVADEPEMSDKAAGMRARAAKSSLPLSTASASDPTDRLSQLDGALPKPKLVGISQITPVMRSNLVK